MGRTNLSQRARALIEDIANEKWVSAATLWEIAIKVSIGKLKLSAPFESFIPRQIETNGFQVLDIRTDHLAAVIDLPFHHRDPFDRLLVAQAVVEKMAIVSNDAVLDAYPLKRFW